MTSSDRYRRLSLWLDTCGDDLTPRPALQGDQTVDVVIVGAGFTGLWTAYALLGADPSLRVLVVEREIAGYGASGRNGGWASDLWPVSWRTMARRHGREAARALHGALVDGIEDIAATLRAEDIDAHLHHGGSLVVARTALQETTLRASAEASRRKDPFDSGMRWVDASDLTTRVRVAGARGATVTPHCARLHPGRLVRGLARAVERRGGRIAERTAVVRVGDHAVHTATGTVHAGMIVRATEAFTTGLPGERRRLLPLYSLVIATAPLSGATWSAIGWEGAETLTDGRHLIVYAQRTAEGRIVFGGRGAPYHYGSLVEPRHDSDPRVFAALEDSLHELFPATGDAEITHRWGGAVAVNRTGGPVVAIDRERGVAWAGGYVGDGVTASNVAGRTLADLILGRHSELSRLPLVHDPGRRWEPEPLRWAGVNLAVTALRGADGAEARTGRRSVRAWLAERVMGR